MRLWVTRAEPDASRQAADLARLGHEPVVEPLLAIAFEDDADLPLDDAQALIATSRNGLRALARRPELGAARKLPIYVVGPGSAALARELGFTSVHEGPGTGDGLVDIVAGGCAADRGPLLHLAGAALASDLKGGLEAKGLSLTQPVLYRAAAASGLSAGLRRALIDGRLDGVILMSPRTAKVYITLVGEGGLSDAARDLHHYCLSEAVAERLTKFGSKRISVAGRPREQDLLALFADRPAVPVCE